MPNKNKKILAIETSCDETAASVLIGIGGKKSENIAAKKIKIKSNIVYSQLLLHRKTKGIVPEVASRAHVEKIIFVIKEALSKAGVRINEIDIIAVTVGPGLIGSLLVGIDTAKSLSYILKKPVIPINHVEAHLYANFVTNKIRKTRNPKSEIRNMFPAIALIVSGGHTSIILMQGHGNYKLLGSTIDDAAGEAFDKIANLLNLPYPGGPAIAAAAAKFKIPPSSRGHQVEGNSKFQIHLPRPMIDSDNFDFSFSGLKTSVFYLIKKLGARKAKKMQAQIAAEFQQAVVDVLVSKTIKAARKYNAKSVMLGGGVAANQLLRSELKRKIKKEFPSSYLLIPNSSLCTDNAAIVGVCGYYKYLAKNNSLKNYKEIKINLEPDL